MVANDDLVMTVESMAKALHISRNLAYDAVRRGEIPSIRVGKRYLIPRHALEKFLRSQVGEADDGGEVAHDNTT